MPKWTQEFDPDSGAYYYYNTQNTLKHIICSLHPLYMNTRGLRSVTLLHLIFVRLFENLPLAPQLDT